MTNQQPDQFPAEAEEQSDAEKDTPTASGDYQTPVDESIRKTGTAIKTSGKPTAEQESGSSDPLVEGGGNQGTEKR